MDPDQIKNAANTIANIAEQAKEYKKSKQVLLDSASRLNSDLKAGKMQKKEFDEEMKKLLKGRTREQELESYNAFIKHLLDQMDGQLDMLRKEAGAGTGKATPSQAQHMNKKIKKKYMGELNITEEQVKKFMGSYRQRRMEAAEKDYVAYTPNEYGKISNRYAGKITAYLLGKKSLEPYFQKLFNDLKESGFKILSKTYVSMIMFSAVIAAIAGTLLASTLFTHPFIPLQIARGIMIGISAGAATGAFMYVYPSNVAGSKRGAMKSELPFMLIHMSAVAGSGAKPIAMFQTLLLSKDYPALSPDVKKIINYVNVFGYDLSTSLRLVSMTTASPEFKDILNGMINTISSGGDMKQFLSSVSQDSLSVYQMERRKSVEVIATYSDVYTALLIAAPLLFFVTLAIIQMLGGTLGGLSSEVIGAIGVYGVIPALNIGYYIFISAVQPA